jgi:hypothetical protein
MTPCRLEIATASLVLLQTIRLKDDYLLWCFARSSTAEEFAAEISAPCWDHHSFFAAVAAA